MSALSPLDKVRLPHYPKALTKRPKQTADENPWLFRQVDVHPAKFVVGMDSDERPLYPEQLYQKYPEQIRDKIKGTAISMASYVARVDEVTKSGGVSVTLWERPNGREGLTTLSVEEHLDGKWPVVGDLLWIWTWIDVVVRHGKKKKKKRIHVEVEHQELTEADRAYLKELISKP